MTRRGARLLLAAAAAMAVSACSQVDALVPVSGVPEATVRIATIDVLQREGVAVLVAPVCTSSTDSISCTGTTVAQEEIAVTSTRTKPLTMTVSVAGRVLYEGLAQSVIDDTGQAES